MSSPAPPPTTTGCSTWSATAASSSSARHRTERTSSTGSGRGSPAGSIDELGFNAVAVEADWPDAYRVNRYVMGLSDDLDADAALSDFRRFPAWMWRNRDVAGVRRVAPGPQRRHRHPATKARFYGLDLYSLQASIEAVIDYLDRVDPAEAARARDRYSCFDHVGAEGQAYGYALAYQARIPCENEVVTQLIELRRRAEAYLRRDGWIAEDELFFAEQNARRRPRRRGVLPADVPRRGLVVEPPRPAHGRHARRADRAPRPRSSATPRSWSGSTTPTSATRGPPHGRTRRAQRRPARPAAIRRTSACSSATRPSTGGHRRDELGRRRRAQACPAGARRRATRRCSTRSALRTSGSRHHDPSAARCRCELRASSGRSA